MSPVFQHIKNVYLIGIGGIGVSALARYFHENGYAVSGYDRVENAQVSSLRALGMDITLDASVEGLSDEFRNTPQDHVLVIYSAAIKTGHPQLDWFSAKGYTIKKRAEVLGMIARDFKLIAVGGTHGKTTTSCLIAHMISQSNIPFQAILGGVSTDLKSNFYTQGERPEWMVTEADEFDGSFLHLDPNICILTSTDADHLDFYQTEEKIKDAFEQFASKTKNDGKLIRQADTEVSVSAPNITYGIDKGEAKATNIRTADRWFYFDYEKGATRIPDLKLGLRGLHNIENAVAAITTCLELGIPQSVIEEGIRSFSGVKRRFEYIVENDNVVYIDDYAHHPTELTTTIRSVRELYPDKKVTGIFQPHLYSRTKDFYKEFAASLDDLDELILMPIYPAREEPIDGVSTEMIARELKKNISSDIKTADQILESIRKEDTQVLLTLGAGDIDRIVEPLKNRLS